MGKKKCRVNCVSYIYYGATEIELEEWDSGVVTTIAAAFFLAGLLCLVVQPIGLF